MKMPFKPNQAPLVKALFHVMLVVCSTIGIATADLLPVNVLRTSQALNTLHVDLAPRATRQKRYLRTAADMTATSTGEVRRLSPLLSELKELILSFNTHEPLLPVKVSQRYSMGPQETMTKTQQELSAQKFEHAFKLFDVEIKNADSFKTDKFHAWEIYLMSQTKEVNKMMFETLVTVLKGEGNLAKILAQGKNSNELYNTLSRLYDYQINHWIQHDSSPDHVFNLLGLQEVRPKELPRLPEFSMWAAFNIKKKSINAAFEFLKGPEHWTLDLDLMQKLAEIPLSDKNFEFAQGLLFSQLNYLKVNRDKIPSSFTLFNLKQADPNKPWVPPTDVTTDPLGKLWVDYVYMKSADSTGHINLASVYMSLKAKILHSRALDVMRKKRWNGYFLKPLKDEDKRITEVDIEPFANSFQLNAPKEKHDR